MSGASQLRAASVPGPEGPVAVRHRAVPAGMGPRGARVTLHVAEAGPEDGAPVVLLHGFPECWWGWRHQIGPLAAAGYRVIVPDQRGYALSDRPDALAAYAMSELVADVRELAEALQLGPVHLVGHDWGGAVAWAVAAVHPELVRTVTVANCPPGHVLARALRRDLQQLRRSWYMAMFQLPGLSEAYLARVGPGRLFGATSAPGTFTADDLATYAEAWAQPGALTAMLRWYRAGLWHRPPDLDRRVPAPALLLWGTADTALGTSLIPAAEAVCDDVRTVRLEGVSHWSPAEGAARVNAELLGHLAAHGGADRLVYKIVPAATWAAVRASGAASWSGSDHDARDGFIHLSAASQVAGTLAKHYAGQRDLVLLGVCPGRLAEGELRWEVSRDGSRFPHLHAPLRLDAVVREEPVTAALQPGP